MAYLKDTVATLILVMVSSSTTLFFGLIVGIAALLTVALYAHAVIAIRQRRETRRALRRRLGLPRKIPGYEHQGTRFQGRANRAGNAKSMAR